MPKEHVRVSRIPPNPFPELSSLLMITQGGWIVEIAPERHSEGGYGSERFTDCCSPSVRTRGGIRGLPSASTMALLRCSPASSEYCFSRAVPSGHKLFEGGQSDRRDGLPRYYKCLSGQRPLYAFDLFTLTN